MCNEVGHLPGYDVHLRLRLGGVAFDYRATAVAARNSMSESRGILGLSAFDTVRITELADELRTRVFADVAAFTVPSPVFLRSCPSSPGAHRSATAE